MNKLRPRVSLLKSAGFFVPVQRTSSRAKPARINTVDPCLNTNARWSAELTQSLASVHTHRWMLLDAMASRIRRVASSLETCHSSLLEAAQLSYLARYLKIPDSVGNHHKAIPTSRKRRVEMDTRHVMPDKVTTRIPASSLDEEMGGMLDE
eukprot:scaffold4120_cov400-Prasinococcus_capsulatus_cf.AAC.9